MNKETENFTFDAMYEAWRDTDDRRRCLFPGKCCMPGDHTSDECHTAEMIEDYEQSYRDAAEAPPVA